MFKTLFRYELKKQFPTQRKEKKDFVGSLVSMLATLTIIGVFVYFMAIISKNYILVRLDKVSSPNQRAYELLNVFYLVVLAVMSIITLENMRKTLADKNDKYVMLKLPVKEQTLFFTKMMVLLIKTYVLAVLLVVPVNAIIYISLMPTAMFWLLSAIVLLAVPIIVFLIAGIFIVPYIMFINFIKNKYVLIFISLLALFVVGVFVYAAFLGMVQSYLETGFIKFLFNEKLVVFLQGLAKWSYPSNVLASIVLNKELLMSCIVVGGCCLVSFTLVYLVAKKLFHITLYKLENQRNFKKKTQFKKRSVGFALLKKEFISISREPKHILSYLVIPTVTPILVYCCYTLFESLILNMLGIQLPMALALLIVIVFSVLTNTFCATNVSREGITFLKQKTLPVNARQILDVKVLFCSIVSLMSTFASSMVLVLATSLSVWDGLLCLTVGAMFTVAQIFLATKIDLKSVKMLRTEEQTAKANSATIAKVVSLGVFVSVITGLATLVVGILSQTGVLNGVLVDLCFTYLIPILSGVIYLGFSIWFYSNKLQESLDDITL